MASLFCHGDQSKVIDSVLELPTGSPLAATAEVISMHVTPSVALVEDVTVSFGVASEAALRTSQGTPCFVTRQVGLSGGTLHGALEVGFYVAEFMGHSNVWSFVARAATLKQVKGSVPDQVSPRQNQIVCYSRKPD